MVLGPVVDLENDPKDEKPPSIIASLNRSFSHDPDIVLDKATGYIDIFHKQGIVTCIKHFPGKGSAMKDSHKGMVDVTDTHTEIDLKPFYDLIKAGKADAVMTAHIINKRYDDYHPATLSQDTMKKLLREKGYDGVIVSDCLHMGAIQEHYSFEEGIVRSIQAGVDILILSNNSAANINAERGKGRIPSYELVEQTIEIIESAVNDGLIEKSHITESYQRILKLKSKIS